MKNIITLVLSLLCINSLVGKELKLWYDSPARYFEETLVMGNGKMGASIFGTVDSDTIYLNDITLWSGEPRENRNPEAYKAVEEIKSALAREDYPTANELQKKLQGGYSESYAPLGTMYINFHTAGAVKG